MTSMRPEEFLLRPRPVDTESLRGFLSRLAAVNLVPRHFWPFMSRVETLTELTVGFAADDSVQPVALHQRIASHRSGQSFQLGYEALPRNCLLISGRRVCPGCLAEDGISRMEWEVKSNRACPRHRCLLVTRCPDCARWLAWHTSEITTCACGMELTGIVAQPAPRYEIRFSGLIGEAVRTSMKTREQALHGTNGGIPLRLEKLLLLRDVVQHVLIPKHIQQKPYRDQTRALVGSILHDRYYRDYLWDKVFLHAASDPMRLTEVLKPGRDVSAICREFGRLAPELYVPAQLWSYAGRRRLGSATEVDGHHEPFCRSLHAVGVCRSIPGWYSWEVPRASSPEDSDVDE
jgi:hypothetical protein